jgi:hypothetical protein
MSDKSNSPAWSAGVSAVKDNAVPSVVILSLSALLVWSYYHSESVHETLDVLGKFNKQHRWTFGILSTAITGGFIPWCFRMSFPSIRPAHPFLDLVHSFLWWAWMGVVVCFFYGLQEQWWGDRVAGKVLVDQLFFTPLVAAPLNAISHYWKDHDWSIEKMKTALRPGWYRRLILPNLLPNYAVWIPGTCIFYSMPSDLVLPVANCIGCFWALLCVRIATHSRSRN